MGAFRAFENGEAADIFCADCAPAGVRRAAGAVAEDMLLAFGKKPRVACGLEGCASGAAVVAAVAGQSAFMDSIAERLAPGAAAAMAGKGERYLMKVAEAPFPEFPGIRQALLILGGDKRGAIYGLFRLSELCGVSPLVFWGDAAPEKKERALIEIDGEPVSREPSVRRRGFFVNDEWPAFGKWCEERYGGINAKAYEKVFELVLRLKGNCLWPAMWRSSFWEDGPGLESARLADEWGVAIGTSHHEPMCRAGPEWQRHWKDYGPSGAWSFGENGRAISGFWRDGLGRSRGFESIVTIGMRGENDSRLMGSGATAQDNVAELKAAISEQNRLIGEAGLGEAPRMLAVYKEVEDFFFGSRGSEGLSGWSGLDGAILLFSDDNHGNLRALPLPEERGRSGGCGVYYHFDYHGGPVSHEWLCSANLAKAWEQLSAAWEHGLCEMWIANVGDVKGNEYPLSFFMDMAYDFDRWGASNPGSAREYAELWVGAQFGAASPEQRERVRLLLQDYTEWAAARIPESLNPGVYKNNFGEIDRAREAALGAIAEAEALRAELPAQCLPAFESMAYYPASAFFNSMLVSLEAGLNRAHAERGALIANLFGASLLGRIERDRRLAGEFHEFSGGKWSHMMDSAHMCFRTWDDHDWAYPAALTVSPIPRPKIVVGFRGESAYTLGLHWQGGEPLCSSEMTRPDVCEALVDIDSRSGAGFSFGITCDRPWLSFSPPSGESRPAERPRTTVRAICDRGKLSGRDAALAQIDFEFAGGEKARALLRFEAAAEDLSRWPGAFLESRGHICIPADKYASARDVGGMGWRVVPRLGRLCGAIKAFPSAKNWEGEGERPYARYEFVAAESREYEICFYMSPRNPARRGEGAKGLFAVNGGPPEPFDVLPPGYAEGACGEWARGVTDNIRKAGTFARFEKGLNELRFYAFAPGAILEKIVAWPKGSSLPETHLGPPESYQIPPK